MKIIKPFVLALIFFLISFLGWGLINQPIFAAQQGINIGALHSQFDQAANLVGPGGWIVVMATPGDCPWLSQMIKSHNVNVIIRGHYPGQHFDGDLAKSWAISWAYTLASMDTGGKKIYFMPLNEPNQSGSGDYQPPGVVVNYTNQIIDQFNKVGIRGSKVILLSPAFNTTHPNIAGYIHQIKAIDPNFFNKFDGISANLYDFEGAPGSVFSAPRGTIPMQNAADFLYLEHNLYGTSKPVYGVEAGVVHPGEGVVYRDEYLKPFVQRAISGLPSVMFAVFSYDPEHQEPWNILTSQTAAVYRSHQGGGGVNYGAPPPADLKTLIKEAKSKGIQLYRCHQNGCGLAVSQSFCNSEGEGFEASGNLGYRIESASDLAQAISDPVSIVQSEEIRWPQSGPKKSVRGLFLENFGNLTYPYIRSVARFLAGNFIFQGGSNQTSVLNHLLTVDKIDELRYQYWQKCKQGVYCNGRIQDEDKCPNQANECLVFTDQGPLNIDEIPPKPLRKNFKYELNYQQALESWQQQYPVKSKYWKEIPIFANPTTLVNNGALAADSCPSFVDQGSTVFSRVSWARTLADISTLLHNLLSPDSNSSSLSLKNKKEKKELASRVLFSTSDSGYLAAAENNNDENNNNNPSDPCQQMKQIFWATIKPVVKLQDGGAAVCWQFDAGSNDSNYSIGDWGLTVFISANGQTRVQSAPMLGGAANVIGQDHPVHLDCHMGTFGGDVFFSGVKKADEVKVSFQLTGGRCKGRLCGQCDFRNAMGTHKAGENKCQPPKRPKFRSLPDPNPVAFQIEGHQRLYGPGTTLYCNNWQPETNPDGTIKTTNDGKPIMKCVDGRISYNVDDPLWLYIAYPYLNIIARNLVAPGNGVYRIFENNQKTTNDWLEAGTSNITFCASDYDSTLKGHFLAMGKTSQELANFNTDVIDGIFLAPYPHNKDFFSRTTNGHENRGECSLGDSVEGIKVYPPYIGGVMNATDTITNCILNSSKENFCQK